jgi:transposase-like protein
MPATRHAKDNGGDNLSIFACPNPDCDRFNRFDAGNLSVVERTGKDKNIRRLYCNCCQHRFSERQGSLMQYTKLPEPAVVRIVKCLGHGCSVEAAADICDVDPRTVDRMLDRAGRRAEDFHRLQLERLAEPIEAVQLDELHGRVCKPPRKKGNPVESRMGVGILDAVAAWVGTGFTRPWRSRRGF